MTDDSLFPPSLPVMNDMRRTRSGREWLDRLPTLVGEFLERWDLRLGAPYHGGSCSWVAPALRADGTRAVLKVSWPHREARPEGEVLKLWAGRGSVLVHEHDPKHYALLLERCEPGTELREARGLPPEERLLLGAGVLTRLWDAGTGGEHRLPSVEQPSTVERLPSVEPPSTGGHLPPVEQLPCVERLSTVTADWAQRAEDRVARYDWPTGVDTGLFTLGANLLRELPYGAGRETIVHGDFNPGNLLAAQREPWLAIDTKPMYGDPAFDPWPLIQQIGDPFAHSDPRRVLTRRTALVADATGADVTRLRAWAVARLVDFLLYHLDGHGDLSDSVRMSDQVRTVAEVAGV
ncbi:aminoglycoside phosphotransferase family protein [Streptomyces marispadix]|uniref:Aminoglycoside phosphotransferase family protein n=1 Tax=Streptomyces marispadix TaxID=2922868 RepID=A0ABS9T4F3_9ACTN|nr:aminoglycoside phosphotransferase family protein [Streptomyces marispadix]MCH6163419.1 aminoglycoside phosphotransferase family protein [Streptomyces marispadix]